MLNKIVKWLNARANRDAVLAEALRNGGLI